MEAAGSAPLPACTATVFLGQAANGPPCILRHVTLARVLPYCNIL
jgi:hypothetical protein